MMSHRATCLLLALSLAACKSAPAPMPESPNNPDTEAPPAAPTPMPKQAEPEVSWYHDAVFYEIFVRSFQDSNGDGIGDLRGIINRLDYLNDGDPSTVEDLGVDALWLMPIFESPSYHGYDVTDYYKVDPDYGTEEDLKALLDACHDRGIKVVLDLMLNHSSSEHPWFIDAKSGPESPYRDWYIFSDTNPGWSQPWGNGPTWHRSGDEYYYGVFWGGMPDLDFTNPEVEAEYLKIADHWLDLGVDGFRLDAIRHLIEDGSSAPDVPAIHDVLKRMSGAIKAEHPEALLIGEIWAGPERIGPYYGQGDELDLAFDFNIAGGIIASTQHKDGSPLREALAKNKAFLPVQSMSAPFLTNHDMDRIAGILGGDTPGLSIALTALMTMPGTPFIYYGEEIGLKNTGVGGDEAKRAPMQWESHGPHYGFTLGETQWAPSLGIGDTYSVAAQEMDIMGLLNHYRALINLRQRTPSLDLGLLYSAEGGSGGRPLILQRAVEGEVAIIALNFSNTESVPVSPSLNPEALDEADLGKVPAEWRVEIPMGRGNEKTALTPELTIDVPSLPPRSASITLLKRP